MHIKLLMQPGARQQESKVQDQVEKLLAFQGFLMQKNPLTVMSNGEFRGKVSRTGCHCD